jgi:hypothetical protein
MAAGAGKVLAVAAGEARPSRKTGGSGVPGARTHAARDSRKTSIRSAPKSIRRAFDPEFNAIDSKV